MSIETSERIHAKDELYEILNKGIDDVKKNKVVSVEEGFRPIEIIVNECRELQK